MCQFNFLVTNKQLNPIEIRKIASEFGLNFSRIKLEILNFGQLQTYLTTTKDCDCGSVVGKAHWENSTEPNWAKERKKLERKRNSKHRIEILLKQKEKEITNKLKEEFQSELNESKNWIGFLTDLRLKNITNEIGIFYHQFSGELKTEKIKIVSENTIAIKNLDVDLLKKIGENELTWIKL